MMNEKRCEGCRHYLGGDNCRIGLEAECAAGGGYEAYEAEGINTAIYVVNGNANGNDAEGA